MSIPPTLLSIGEKNWLCPLLYWEQRSQQRRSSLMSKPCIPIHKHLCLFCSHASILHSYLSNKRKSVPPPGQAADVTNPSPHILDTPYPITLSPQRCHISLAPVISPKVLFNLLLHHLKHSAPSSLPGTTIMFCLRFFGTPSIITPRNRALPLMCLGCIFHYADCGE